VVGRRFHEILDEVIARPGRGGSNDGPPTNGTRHATGLLEDRIRTIAAPGDIVLMPVAGGALPDLNPQRAWPFPQERDGGPGDDPVDGSAAVNHLESQRRRGARWFALPASAFSWRHRYPKLFDHLETRHRRLHHDEHLVLYELDGHRHRMGPAAAPSASVHVLGTYSAGRTGPRQASDYASGFASRIFPGRDVPDVARLVGMQPRAGDAPEVFDTCAPR